MFKYILVLITTLLFPTASSFAQDYHQIKNLSGAWYFSVGDNKAWANPNYDDSDWAHIKAPGSWEKGGYDNYDGFAWYRKTFRLGQLDFDSQIYLMLGKIDDADEVYLNGELIAKSGDFPPNFKAKFDISRTYWIPAEKLKANASNTIAIRVYDAYGKGGIVSGKVGLYTDPDMDYIDLSLSGLWKFKTGKNKDWNKKKFDDANWDEIHVPYCWENQGYRDYDGYACYRKTFTIPDDFNMRNLYLILGKIDDFDYVYINGKYIGSYEDIEHNFSYKGNSNVWRNMRYYSIPNGLLIEGLNQITVNVYDRHGEGGIYKGPVGITSKSNYLKIEEKYRGQRSFWEILIESIID